MGTLNTPADKPVDVDVPVPAYVPAPVPAWPWLPCAASLS